MANYDKNIKINLDYSTFTGGITQCQAKIKTLNEAMKLSSAVMQESGDSSTALAEREQLLTAKIQLQKSVLEQTIAKYQNLKEDSGATTAALERMEQQVLKQETALAKMNAELNSVVAEEEAMSESTDQAGAALDSAGGNTVSFTDKLSSAVTTLSAFSSAASAVASEISNLASSAAALGDDLITQSQITGLSTQALQELSYASDFVDVSVDTMTSSMTKMIRNMDEANSGSEAAAEKFRALGVSITDSSGDLKSSEQMFNELIDALGQIENETERDAAAMNVFGKSAQQLNPLIEAGSSRLAELRREAVETGNVLTDNEVYALGEVQDALDRMNSEAETATYRLGAALAPAVMLAANAFNSLPEPLQMGIVATKSIFSVMSSLVPVMTMLNTQTIATAASQGTLAAAEATKSSVDVVATTTTWGLNAALAVQVAEIALVVAAVVALAYIIYTLINAFNGEAGAADKATSSINRYAAAVSSVGSNSIPSVSANRAQHRALGGKIYPHAAQGYESVWVGEQGAELVDLPAGSTVYNHEDSRNMASTTNYFNVTIDARSVDEMTKVVKVFNGLSQAMNRGGRLNR